MSQTQLLRVKSITDYHRLWQLPKPEHPLVSVIDIEAVTPPFGVEPMNIIFEFYCISMKRGPRFKYKYGQQVRESEEGVLFFISPEQVFSFEIPMGATERPTGWVMLVHPDLLWNTSLARSIKQYEFFGYAVSEALHLSDKEEGMLNSIADNIKQEYHSNIDRFTQNVIIAQLELLLTYADRFYQRQDRKAHV